MSPGRRLVPSLLCLGMALVPLLALRGGNFGAARITVSAAAGDPLAGRQVPERASRSAAARSVDVAAASAPTAELVSAATPGGAPIASITSAPASTLPSGKPHVAASRHSSPRPPTAPRPSPPRPIPPRPSESGEASWYGAPAGTCAHPSLPLGTIVTVTDVETGRSTTCRVADRGPYATGRVIDLSEAAFAQLAPLAVGVIEVRLTW